MKAGRYKENFLQRQVIISGGHMEHKIANRYQLLELLGVGSFGTVYRARDELLERIVAVKLIGQSDDQSEAEQSNFKLKTEAQIMAQVHHPNITPVYDLIEADDTLCIVMPFLPARYRDLQSRPHERPLMETMRFLERIAAGLDFLHRHNIMHRNLTPENILIGGDD